MAVFDVATKAATVGGSAIALPLSIGGNGSFIAGFAGLAKGCKEGARQAYEWGQRQF